MESIIFKIKKYGLILLNPFIVFVGKIKMPFVSKAKIFHSFYDISSLLQDGDILLSRSNGHLSNLLNRLVNQSIYSHSAMYIGKDYSKQYVIESIGDGVCKKTLPEFLSDKDGLAIVRLNNPLSEDEKNIVIDFLYSKLGMKYDYLFDLRNEPGKEAYYCSELVYFALKDARPNLEFKRKNNIWDSVVPSDFYKAKKYFNVRYEV